MKLSLRPISGWRCLGIALAISAMSGWTTANCCHAELTVIENANDQQGLTVFQMTVTPAAEPVPSLKHRLTLRERQYKAGNAATHYLRAFPEGGFERTWKGLETEFGEEAINRWYVTSEPLNELPIDKLRLAAARFDTFINSFMTPASERLDCDWGHGIITELRGPDIYGFLLPEIQTMRGIGRAIILCTRVAIADHDYDHAIKLLRMNYRLGENVAKSPFIVSGLVGLAICGMGNVEVVELIAAPDSPNLYWALAELPHPLVDLRAAIRHELSFNVAVFPFMDSPEKAEHSPQEWARLLTDAMKSLQPLSGSGPQLNDLEAQLAVTGLACVGYSGAKQRLIDAGMSPAEAAAMSVGQVIAIDSERQYRRIGDEVEKWWYVPFQQSRNRQGGFDRMTAGNPLEGGFGKTLAKLLLPALQAARDAQVRVMWQLGALQTIEAIRMHAAKTGKLPTSLDEIAIVPIPENPVTGESYKYQLTDDTAILELPFSDGFPGIAWRFEIKLAK